MLKRNLKKARNTYIQDKYTSSFETYYDLDEDCCTRKTFWRFALLLCVVLALSFFLNKEEIVLQETQWHTLESVRLRTGESVKLDERSSDEQRITLKATSSAMPLRQRNSNVSVRSNFIEFINHKAVWPNWDPIHNRHSMAATGEEVRNRLPFRLLLKFKFLFKKNLKKNIYINIDFNFI